MLPNNYNREETANSLLEYNLMWLYSEHLHHRQNVLPSFTNFAWNEISGYIEEAQVWPNPSDVTIFLSKNEYTRIGLKLKNKNIPYKLRLSRVIREEVSFLVMGSLVAFLELFHSILLLFFSLGDGTQCR